MVQVINYTRKGVSFLNIGDVINVRYDVGGGRSIKSHTKFFNHQQYGHCSNKFPYKENLVSENRGSEEENYVIVETLISCEINISDVGFMFFHHVHDAHLK